MSIKSKVSSNYLEAQRGLHGLKLWNPNHVRALISGSGKPDSIGETIATRLKGKGHNVKETDFDVRNIPGDPGRFEFFSALVLCHGVSWLDWFEDFSLVRAKEIVDVNLTGTIDLIQKFVQDTINTKERKRIIVIGSMAHRVVLNGSAVYCATKAALAMLVRCLAWELAPKGYDVFIIHPSNTWGSPMSEETIQGLERYRNITRGEAEAYWNDSPIRDHILTRTEITELVLYLLGPYGEYLAGSQLELAGGQR